MLGIIRQFEAGCLRTLSPLSASAEKRWFESRDGGVSRVHRVRKIPKSSARGAARIRYAGGTALGRAGGSVPGQQAAGGVRSTDSCWPGASVHMDLDSGPEHCAKNTTTADGAEWAQVGGRGRGMSGFLALGGVLDRTPAQAAAEG